MQHCLIILQELQKGEQIACRCNGVTAGCAFQFCHRRIVEFKHVANRLTQKYESAVKVNDRSWRSQTLPNAPAPNKVFTITEEYKDKMLYLSDGPNQCRVTKGYQSVSRRQCVLDKSKTNSCDKLCCQRGYRERVIEVHSQCRCKFVYCCKVVCDTCKGSKKIFECL